MITNIFLVTIFSAILSVSQPIKNFRWENIKYVYSFGDSYSFVPGTFGLPSFSFIGDATSLAFTPEQLLTNEIIPNMTSSGGSNWLEFLTGCYEGLPAECPIQLWDFAYGGADIDGTLVPPHRNTTVQLALQVQQWLDYAADVLPRPEGKTLTSWWVGINDCSDITNNATIMDVDAFLDVDIEAYFKIVETAARNGLHIHLFLNVPPVDKSPFATTIRTGPEGLKVTIENFNKKFFVRLAKYSKDNPDQIVLSFDAAGLFTDILEHPTQFGFTNVTTNCTLCPNQEQFFWHNTEHPTPHVHKILAEAVEDYLRYPILN